MTDTELIIRLITVLFVGCIVWLNCRIFIRHRHFKKLMEIDAELNNDFLTALEIGDKEELLRIKRLIGNNLYEMRKAI